MLHLFEQFDWLAGFQALTSATTALVAFLALRSWRGQDRAKREAEFLSDLIDATHAYAIEIATPITMLEFARIGMASHTPNWEEGVTDKKVSDGAIVYIKRDGERDAKRIRETLVQSRLAVIRLRSLGTKGQIFSFRDYEKCFSSVEMLAWQFRRIEAFANIVGSSSLNWANSEVMRSLNNVLEIRPDEMRQ